MSRPKFIADENVPRTTIILLREKDYDVISIWELRPGMNDEEVVELAVKESRIIITFDKDFGRLALLKTNIPGVILLRIPPLNPAYVAERILLALGSVDNPYGKLIIIRKKTVKVITLHQ